MSNQVKTRLAITYRDLSGFAECLTRGAVVKYPCSEAPAAEAEHSHLRSGDTLVVWRLDRIAHSLSNFIELVNKLAGQGIAFKSLAERIDTSLASGKLVFHIFGALAEFERNLIKERTLAGLSAARARRRMEGRPRLNPKSGKVALARKLYADQSNAISGICKTLHISRATLYQYINWHRPGTEAR
jgi:DNA invertase Pin-like site-specific DNA recombinase